MITALWVTGVVAMFAVRAPHIRRSFARTVVASHESRSDRACVAMVGLGLVLPLLWIFTPALAFADVPVSMARVGAGVACLLFGLWVLHRSHADLGMNWSNTLELRAGHSLVTRGVYRYVRHPMYVALLLHGLGQALLLPNLVAGPSFLVAFAVLVVVRLGAEEQMMRGAFGDAYAGYSARTARLIPGLF